MFHGSAAFFLLVLVCFLQCAPLRPGTIVAELKADAARLRPLLRSPLSQEYLDATAKLPPIPERYLQGKVYTEEDYYLEVSTPLAWGRALDLLSEAGLQSVRGKKILDFGHGGIASLRLLAALSAEVVGVDVNEARYALYSQPGDQGPLAGGGSLRLVLGRFPKDPKVQEQVGGGYDLILSKNTLKRGYLHPERPVNNPKWLIDLGVDDETFVKALYGILNPGGLVLIYNLAPAKAPPDRPFLPWSDGRIPFSKELLTQTGFRLRSPYDADDTEAARKMATALRWGQRDPRHPESPPMDIHNDLFATYVILEKPAR